MNNLVPTNFQWETYIKLNSDIKHINNEKDAVNHYCTYGKNENRVYKITIPSDFNWKVYIKLNRDIEHINNEKDAINHYCTYGKHENRVYKITIPTDFNWKAYIKLNLDIKHTNNEKDAINHYYTYGKNENRAYKYKIPYDFNWKNYIKMNSDIKHITNESEARKHYRDYGINENRPYKLNNNNTNLFTLPSSQLLISNQSDKDYDKNMYVYSCLDEIDIVLTKPFFENVNYKQYSVDENILNNLNSFWLIIDFDNGGGGTTFFLNTIVSKYKYNQTFVIIRNYNGNHQININEDYIINVDYNDADICIFLDMFKDKFSKCFINHIKGHSALFLNKLTSLNKYIITITHDYSFMSTNPQPYYHELHELINNNNSIIDINNVNLLITQHKLNVDIFASSYKENIEVVQLPDYKYSDKKYKYTNNVVVIGIIGNIIDIKGRKILHKIQNYYINNPDIKIVVFGHVKSNICTNRHSYNSISDLNNLLITHKPNVLLELSLWPETYSYTLTLSMLSQLPILYLTKNFPSVVMNRLHEYKKAYSFDTLAQLDALIEKHKQFYLYTIKPVIYFDQYWDNLFITNSSKLYKSLSETTPVHNIKSYFIYFPQFHQMPENDCLFYNGFNDIKNLELYNSVTDVKLETPLLEYLKIENYNKYDLTNANILQKQIDLIEYYGFEGIAMYYYWFSKNNISQNKMVMSKVVDLFFSTDINNKNRNIFFIWANEDWTNNPAFGISDKHKIINIYDEDSFKQNALNLMTYFKHERYLKIDNKPVFFVYHNYLLQNIDLFYEILERVCLKNGFSGVHLVLNSFANDTPNSRFTEFYINFNYKKYSSRFIDNKNQMTIDYKEYIDNEQHIHPNTIQTLVWDFNNKSRLCKPDRLDKSTVCINNTEINKVLFAQKLIKTYERSNKTEIENILLINSFNEWGEKMAFEPSEQYGYYNMNKLHDILFK